LAQGIDLEGREGMSFAVLEGTIGCPDLLATIIYMEVRGTTGYTVVQGTTEYTVVWGMTI